MVTFSIESNGPYLRITINENGNHHVYTEPYSIAKYQFEPRVLNALGRELVRAEKEHATKVANKE